MKVLNLGCGLKISNDANVINIDWSVYLRLSRIPLVKYLATYFLDNDRAKRIKSLSENIMVYNLAHGIPFGENSVDAVYHSHLLEHLDASVALLFLEEIFRVLIPGGIVRIVVPDFELLVREYIANVEECKLKPELMFDHDQFLVPLIEQCVRREAYGTSQQSGIRRFLENFLFGDARRRGETHQWMYDRFNLQAKLQATGFTEIRVLEYNSSGIENWHCFGLDTNQDGTQYKLCSLYMEARKPNGSGLKK